MTRGRSAPCSQLNVLKLGTLGMRDEEVQAVSTQGVHSDPRVMMGKPVVQGTRITVEHVLEELGAGRSIEEILEAHPRLTREGVLAAIRFGAECLRADVSYPVSKSVA
jgi:uncharacterized protein (DUF433 family)